MRTIIRMGSRGVSALPGGAPDPPPDALVDAVSAAATPAPTVTAVSVSQRRRGPTRGAGETAGQR